MAGGTTQGWPIRARSGNVDYRIKRWGTLGVGEDSQFSSRYVMSIMNLLALHNNEATAHAIFADLTGASPGSASLHLDARGWTMLRQAFERRIYVIVHMRGTPYTSHPNEVGTRTTTPTVFDVMSMLHQAWPELNDIGIRMLTAQFMHETGDGARCFNWNLGNEKAGTDRVPHMYLADTWEPLSPTLAAKSVANDPERVFYASDALIRKRQWKARPGTVIVVFEPPNPGAMFRAYASLQDGAQHWVHRYRGLIVKRPDFWTALVTGDTNKMAAILNEEHYYTGHPGSYATQLHDKLTRIERGLTAPH